LGSFFGNLPSRLNYSHLWFNCPLGQKRKGYLFSTSSGFIIQLLKELLKNKSIKIKGKHKVINYTNYIEGYSILRTEKSDDIYNDFLKTIKTLDESIMDKVLKDRGYKKPWFMTKTKKTVILLKLIKKDILRVKLYSK